MTRPEKTFAVVVGVEKYAAGAEWDLDGPAYDAGRFVHWLRRNGVPASQILLFLSPLEANRARANQLDVPAQPAENALITAALTDTLPQQMGDLLFFFWGGHGVIDVEGNRRLFYSDAMTNNLRNLNLNDLLNAWRTEALGGFPRQICLVDTCANYLEHMRQAVSLPDVKLPAGLPMVGVEQFALLAAAPGELAKNRGSGLFSSALLDKLGQSGAAWPPDMAALNQQLQEQFATLRDRGETRQTPAHIWYRDWHGDEGTLSTLARAKGALPPDEEDEELDFAGRMKLVEALLACEVMTSPQSRDSVIGDLRREIRERTERSAAARQDVIGLVRTALNYSGGLKELIYVVQIYEGESKGRKKLDNVVRELLPRLL
jgi:hypothetical protein